MKTKSLIFFVFCVIPAFVSAQGRKIALREVAVFEKALPTIAVDGALYSFRERDFFVKMVLKSRFWQKSFYIRMDLVSFYSDQTLRYEIAGKTKVFINDAILGRKHAFKKKKVIQALNNSIENIRIYQKNQNREIYINTIQSSADPLL